jgi:spore maturation protein CgeB
MKTRKVLFASDFRNPWNPGYFMKEGLVKNNMEVSLIDTMGSEDAYHDLTSAVERFKPDMLLIIKDYGMRPEWLYEIKRKSVLLVQWYIDPVIPEWLPPFVKLSDFFFTMSEGLIEEFRRLGGEQVFWLSQGFEPSFYNIEKTTEKDVKFYGTDITFVGNLGSLSQYLPRRKYIQRILDEGFRFKWWGTHLPRKISTIPLILGRFGRSYGGKFIWGREYAKVARLSKVFLAFDSMPRIRKSMSARMYTAVGCGAFYMCQHVDGIEEVLEPGKEIVTFRSEEEMVDMIRFYLRNDGLRARISEAGQRRVLKEHTYEARIRNMLETIENAV